MINKQIIFLIIISFLLTSCGDTLSSVKRGLTGEKEISSDEFLVQKKDPLILPPNYDSLPTPDERDDVMEEISMLEKKLNKNNSADDSSSVTSTEKSIMKKIKKQ